MPEEPGFERFFLWQLKRTQIRSITRQFISLPVGDNRGLEEDYTTQRIVDDFENLNLHRTPLNCILLLKIAADQIDDSPVNRTEMIERFLFLLFNTLSNIPKYSTIPDLKDSLNVLGFFCEHLIRSKAYYFEKSDFFDIITAYCKDKLISIETDVLFGCLVNENILIQRAGLYTFRYTVWINFFTAQRMLQNKPFRQYMLADRKYTISPEIIEFYSGIDRRRTYLLVKMTEDLEFLNDSFESRTNIPNSFNPYERAQWRLNDDEVEAMHKDIEDTVNNSSAPLEYRDALADRDFNRARAYNQKMNEFIEDSSIHEAIRVMKAASRALRNSDYVDAKIKTKLLSEILRTWSKVIQMATILAPALASDNTASFDGFRFYLSGFDNIEEDYLWHAIMDCIPSNVVGYYEKDFSSKKMGPLLDHYLATTDNELKQHILIAQIIRTRPKDWESITQKHLMGLGKQSFFLYQAYREAKKQYRVGFANTEEKSVLKNIMGLSVAKHHGAKRPNRKQITQSGDRVVKSFTKEDSST